MNCFDPTPEDLDRIKDLAAAFSPIGEIAVLMDCDEDILRETLRSKGSLRQAYLSGKAESALAIRKAEINMAAAGSPMAIQHAASFMTAMTDSEID